MIFDELVVTEKALRDLKKKADLKKNKDLQEKTDTKYRLLLKQTETFITTIEYLYKNVKVQKNDEILNSTKKLLDILEMTISTGLAIQDDVTKAENFCNKVFVEMKKEWSERYSDITGPTVSTLEAIKGIDPDSVDSCLKKIQGANEWALGKNQYVTMTEGLYEAEQLIVKLGLDDEIVSFLQNTNAGRATLMDLNDKVLKWIRDERLEGKIKISFMKNGRI